MSGHAKRVASALALVLACSTFTAGAALAGDGNGKSDEAPGQQQAEVSQQAATPPGQEKKAEATATIEAKGQANQEARAAGPGVKPGNTTSKWTTCSTGGGTGANATCAGTHSPKPDSSKQYGNGETAAQIANERGAPAGTTIKGPGNSQPHKVAVCPRKTNRSGGVDVHAVKSYSTAACAEQPQQPQQEQKQQPVVPQPTVTVTPTVTSQPTVTVTPTATPSAAGVAGAQAAGPKPQPQAAGQPAPSGKPAPAGSVLGALARAGRAGQLPFTGLPLWIAALAAFALLGGGFAVRRVAAGS